MRLMFLSFAVLLAGCLPAGLPPPQPTQNYQLGEMTLYDPFDRTGEWRTYDMEGIQLDMRDGAFYASIQTPQYVWTQNRTSHDDVVIEVEAFNQNDEDEAIYGVMCRASPQNNGWGYYFLVTSDGYYAIRQGRGGELKPLVASLQSDAIVRGMGRNRLRAVCIDDYLALYVNGEFVAETRDHLYKEGYSGLAVGLFDPGSLDVRFDDLRVWDAGLR